MEFRMKWGGNSEFSLTTFDTYFNTFYTVLWIKGCDQTCGLVSNNRVCILQKIEQQSNRPVSTSPPSTYPYLASTQGMVQAVASVGSPYYVQAAQYGKYTVEHKWYSENYVSWA